MKPLYVINDLHLSAIRTGGTTPTTALQLRQALQEGFKRMLNLCDSDVLINGDFADSYKMIAADILEAHRTISEWLRRGHTLYALPGNHCLSKSSMDLSSFELLFQLLKAEYPEQVKLMMEAGHVRDGMYAIPHVANSELFELELARVPESLYLFVHVNFDNHFAVCNDHSLNLSEEWAKKLPVQQIIFGHEHQHRTLLNGKVLIVGNQQPSSISDCLGNEAKFMLRLSDDGIEKIQTWQAAGSFSEQDWRSLEDKGEFIRVTGSATSEEAGAVVTAISKFRASAKALVITNAVSIAGVQDGQQIEVTLEQVRGFSVFDALLECLTEAEGEKLKTLRREQNV